MEVLFFLIYGICVFCSSKELLHAISYFFLYSFHMPWKKKTVELNHKIAHLLRKFLNKNEKAKQIVVWAHSNSIQFHRNYLLITTTSTELCLA